MANRRSLSKSISVSEQANSLSDFAALLFTWCIPHLDDFGRMSGSPAVVKAMVIPMRKQTAQEVAQALQEMVDAGLIYWYEWKGEKIIQFIKFEQHQTGLNKRTRSKYPSYEEVMKFQEIHGNSSLTEEKRTEQKRKEENRNEQKGTEENGNKLPATPAADESIKQIYKALTNAGILMPSTFEIDKLASWLDSIELEAITYAIEKAALAGVRTTKYIDSILRGWHQKGIKTKLQALDDDVQFQKRKESAKGGTPTSGAAVPKKDTVEVNEETVRSATSWFSFKRDMYLDENPNASRDQVIAYLESLEYLPETPAIKARALERVCCDSS